MKSKSLSWQTESVIDQLYEVLSSGSVTLTSTDTVLGLLVCATQEGHDKLDNMKGRKEKPYLILFDSYDSVISYIKPISLQLEKFIKQCWPGPVTFILNARHDVPSYMKASDNTIAIRVPDHQGLQVLLRKTGPLFSTSANKTGQPVPLAIKDVDLSIREECCLVVTDNQENAISSTMIDCTREKVRIIREGVLTRHILEKRYEKTINS